MLGHKLFVRVQIFGEGRRHNATGPSARLKIAFYINRCKAIDGSKKAFYTWFWLWTAAPWAQNCPILSQVLKRINKHILEWGHLKHACGQVYLGHQNPRCFFWTFLFHWTQSITKFTSEMIIASTVIAATTTKGRAPSYFFLSPM